MQDAIQRAPKEPENWSIRPDDIERRLMARALRARNGVTRTRIMRECLMLGLRKYAGKKDSETGQLSA